MSNAAQAYARAAVATGNPHDIKAQVLLKAASKLQALVTNGQATRAQASEALTFNETFWTIFLADVRDDKDSYPPELRETLTDIGAFVLSHTWALQASPVQLEEFKPLIEINRNFATGLRSRA
jgi:flagellar protein FlaF